MKYDYNFEQVAVDDNEVNELIQEIAGGQAWDYTNLEDQFEEDAVDIIRDAVEESGGFEEDFDEALEADKEDVLKEITKDYRDSFTEYLEMAIDNLKDALEEVQNID